MRDAVAEPRTVFTVGPKDGGKRLDHFLKERIPGLSRSRIQLAIRTRVDLSWGARARSSTPVRPGGAVRISHTSVTETLLRIHVVVLARGSGWLVVDKPPGIPVHPVNRVLENSLIRILRRQEDLESLRLVHRLDRETSGALVVASDSPTARSLSLAFARGLVHKEYLALVAGSPSADAGVVEVPLGDAAASEVYVRREASEQGQRAVTLWRVERRLEDRTLLRVFPRTGRRHQIRVHLATLGHPVLGDPLYGRPDRDYLDLVRGLRDARKEEGGPSRQLLHCARLVFPDPLSGREVDVCSPLPGDFLRELSADGRERTLRAEHHARAHPETA